MATQPAFTPGPWTVEAVTNEDGEQFWSDDWNGKVFCVCHPATQCDATTVVPWLDEANARLISAAPDLLEALESILPSALCGESWNLSDDESVSIIINFGKLRRARAAIAKATGAL